MTRMTDTLWQFLVRSGDPLIDRFDQPLAGIAREDILDYQVPVEVKEVFLLVSHIVLSFVILTGYSFFGLEIFRLFSQRILRQ